MLKAVIFDMDGVLVDSEPLHAKSFVIAMEQFGVVITTEYNYKFIGSTTLRMCESVIEEFNLSITPEEILVANSKAVHQLVKEEGYTPIPYTKELIKDLYKHGVTLAIASSSSAKDIENVTKALGIKKYFDKFISGATLLNPKPAPDIFLKALKELGVKASESIVIEDSMNGSMASKSAGIPCIGFINKNSGNQDLSAANVLIESFEYINYSFINDELTRANGEPVTIALTNRLILRELAVSDIKSLYDIYSNPEVRNYIDDIDDYLEIEIEKHKAYIKNIYSFYGYGLWGVFSKADNKLIGRCGIQNRGIDGQNEIELGYLLDVNHWGLGYAIECITATLDYAFNTLELQRIVAVIDKRNARSIKVAKQIGMTLEKEIKDLDRDCFLYVINNTSDK